LKSELEELFRRTAPLYPSSTIFLNRWTTVGALAARFSDSGLELQDRSRSEALWALLSNLDGDDAASSPPKKRNWCAKSERSMAYRAMTFEKKNPGPISYIGKR
jgi:hypothetical protein